jgi:hypothetical protein
MYPTTPIAAMPNRQIFMESQSSSRLGLVANFNSLAAELKKDLMPKVVQPSNNNKFLI